MESDEIEGRAESQQRDETRHAGRGFLWVAAGKIIFIVTSFGVALALPRLFSQEMFGRFSVVFGLASIGNNILVASTLQTVSKLVADDDAQSLGTLRRGLSVQAVIGAILGAALFLGAPLLADFYNDPERAPLFRVAGFVLFAYAIYATCVGYLNGRRRFADQARLDMTFAALRTTGLIGGAALGIGAIGAMLGFGIAAGTIMVVGLVVVGLGRPGSTLPIRRWLTLLAPIALYQLSLNGLMQVDLQMLDVTVSDIAVREGRSLDVARELSGSLSAAYSAAQKFAFVPYQLILSVTFIVFPMVSRATTLGDEATTQRYIRGAMRFSLLVLLWIATPIAGAASGVMRIAYPESYLIGSDALGVLVLGQVAFALFVIGATILTGAGRALHAAGIGVGALVVVLIGTRLAVTSAGIDGDAALVATALGTSLGTVLALVAVGVTVHAAFGAFIPTMSALRCLGAGATGFAVARFVPHETAFTAILALGLGFVAYGVALVAFSEVGKTELEALRTILRRSEK